MTTADNSSESAIRWSILRHQLLRDTALGHFSWSRSFVGHKKVYKALDPDRQATLFTPTEKRSLAKLDADGVFTSLPTGPSFYSTRTLTLNATGAALLDQWNAEHPEVVSAPSGN
jgi:hypothetical protein